MPFRKLKFFSELRQDEKIYLVLREHWILPLVKVAFWILLMISVGLAEGLLQSWIPFFYEDLPQALFTVVRSMFAIAASLGLFIIWVMYYLNVQIITDERIVDINQKSLLSHQTSELNLDRFQDVTTEVVGPMANLFDYGVVRVQTAGEMKNFVFNNIPNPHKVAKIILELYENLRAKQGHMPRD